MAEKSRVERIWRTSLDWFIDSALEQCRKTLVVYEDAMPISGRALAMGLSWLEKAERLKLSVPLIPDGAEEKRVVTSGEYGYGLDAPWQVTAIEYEHGGVYDVRQDYTRALSTRRIALCVVISDESTPMDGPLNEGASAVNGSLLVWPITYFDEKKEWEFSPGVVLVPRAQAEVELGLAANQFTAVLAAAEQRFLRLVGRPQVLRPMVTRFQPMMPELCVKLGEEHSSKMIRESSLDALWAALGTFSAMGCKNVYVRKESRDLSCFDNRGMRSALDAFRGRRLVSWSGRGKWDQQTELALHRSRRKYF